MKGPAKTPPKHKRHANRDRCSYCGSRMFLQNTGLKYPDFQKVRKSWDHILPASVGGLLMIPCCGMCNSKKGNTPVSAFLRSDWLSERRQFVLGDWKSAAPPWLDENIVRELEQEDLSAAKARHREVLAVLDGWVST